MPTAWTLSLVYTGGGLDAPGGIMFDREGAVWTSNNFTAGSQSFLQQRGFPGLGATKLAPDGKPLSGPFGFEGAGVLGAGYGIAIDQRGHVWIGNFAGNSLSELRPDGTPGSPTAYTAGGTMAGVQGVAVDQQGNVWAANDVSKNVTLHRPSTGQTQSFANDPGMVGPWGINVDGDDNVWVADFWGQRLSNLCGVAGRCPPGVTLGSPISPPSGYGANGGLQHITYVGVDQSGNVWAANNNHDQPLCDVPPSQDAPPSVEIERRSMACGGNGVVVVFGLAPPLANPLIGLPSQP